MRDQWNNLLRWPLWSWRNLAITAVALLLVLFTMGRVIGPTKSTPPVAHGPAATATSTPSTTQDPKSPFSGAPTATDTTAPTAPSTPVLHLSVTRLATEFTQAWSASTRSQREWTHGIQAFVTPALAAGLAQTDPARVPATKVTGEARLITASATLASVTVPTDGGPIVVTMTRGDLETSPWQVSDVAPGGQPPAAPTPDLHPTTSPVRG